MYVFFGQKKPVKYSTGLNVPTKFWNFELQRVREVREMQQAKAMNIKLNKLQAQVASIFEMNSSPSAEELRRELKSVSCKASSTKDSFMSFFSLYILENKEKSNVRSYESTYKHWRRLMPNWLGVSEVDYSQLSNFRRKFKESIIEVGANKGEPPSANHTATQIKNIKAVLNEARKRGYSVSQSIADFSKGGEDHESVYLTSSEIEKIQNTVVPKSYQKSKDLFLIGCYTAMRFSDYSQLCKANIRGGLIYRSTVKTKKQVVIPVHPIVLEILERYDFKVPALSNSIVNRQIKEIAKLSGINDVIEVAKTRGSKRVSSFYKKWELITTHTARRSGATNMYLAGIPSISVMMITGHKTEKSFMRYIKVTAEQNAQILANHEFFK